MHLTSTTTRDPNLVSIYMWVLSNHTLSGMLYSTWWVNLQWISDGTSDQHHLSITLVTGTAIYILKSLCGNVAVVVKHGKVHSMKQLQKELWTHGDPRQQSRNKSWVTWPIWWTLVMTWLVETLSHQSVRMLTASSGIHNIITTVCYWLLSSLQFIVNFAVAHFNTIPLTCTQVSSAGFVCRFLLTMHIFFSPACNMPCPCNHKLQVLSPTACLFLSTGSWYLF